MSESQANENSAVGPELIGRLFDSHARALVLYARQLSADPTDVVQQAFMKLTEQREMPREPVAWLYRVVRNEALMASRAKRRRHQRETQAAQSKDKWFHASDTDSIDVETVANSVAALSKEQREIVTAHVWGGLSFREIGNLMEMSSSSAHRCYQQALQNLRVRKGIPCKEQI